MPEEADKRLARLRNELMDIRFDYKWSAFDIITCSSASTISWTSHELQFLQRFLSKPREDFFHFRGNGPGVHSVIEAASNGHSCVVWCGVEDDPVGLERLQEWSDRCAQFLNLNSTWARRFQLQKPYRGRANLIDSLCRFAASTTELSNTIREQVILDLGDEELPRGLPVSLKKLKRPAKFSVLNPDGSGPQFLLRIFDHVLGMPHQGPRLTASVEEKTATLDGVTYSIDWPFILVVDALVQGNGNPISRRWMQELHPELKDYDRLDREVIKKLKDRECPQIGKLIQSSHAGYWFPAEHLA